jgi:hypothetical protein
VVVHSNDDTNDGMWMVAGTLGIWGQAALISNLESMKGGAHQEALIETMSLTLYKYHKIMMIEEEGRG